MAIARRYEIYLPLTYNDGHPVERRKFKQTRAELLTRFGGLTRMPLEMATALMGEWMAGKQLYEDRIATYVIYSLDINAADAFMRPYKEKLKRRFRQLEILLVAQLVELF
jgi:hypothetical protein